MTEHKIEVSGVPWPCLLTSVSLLVFVKSRY